MYIGWSMRTNLYTVSPETSIFKARELMDTHRISHLPVTDGKAHLVGFLTDRDLKEAWASPATTLSVHELTYVLQKLTVGHVMTKDVLTVTPDMTIERAGAMMMERKIGGLPVVKDGKLVGIITITDLMQVLLLAMGVGEGSRRLCILVRDRIGVLAEVGRILQAEEVNIRSIMTKPLPNHHDVWQLLVRVDEVDFTKAVKGLKDAGFPVILEYVEDLTPFLPKP